MTNVNPWSNKAKIDFLKKNLEDNAKIQELERLKEIEEQEKLKNDKFKKKPPQTKQKKKLTHDELNIQTNTELDQSYDKSDTTSNLSLDGTSDDNVNIVNYVDDFFE